jgi:hypothetical protein
VKGSAARRARAAGAGLVAGVLLASVSGCGGSGNGPGANAQLQFAANAAGLIGQLHDDLAVGQAEASSVPTARRTLHDASDLLATFVAFTDFGSCGQMVENTGHPTGKLLRVQATLRSACGVLERATRLFSDAEIHLNPYTLVAATQMTARVLPLLDRAQVELDAAGPRLH